MGRLVAAVIALAVFVTGAMYWSRAEQLSESDQPLAPEISIKVATDGCPDEGCGDCPAKAVDAAKADCSKGCCGDKAADAAKTGGCCGGDKSAEPKAEEASAKSGCSKGCCGDKATDKTSTV